MSHITQMITKLKGQIIFLQFLLAVLPKNQRTSFKENRDALIIASEFVDHFDKTQMKKGKALSVALQKDIDKFKEDGFIKIPENEIALKFYTYCQSNKEYFRYGIEFGLLNELIDCSKLGFPCDLPYQTRIGLGNHAGSLSVEEAFLLHDSFYLLLKARESHGDLVAYTKKWKVQDNNENIDEVMHYLGKANQNVAIHSRLCILSYFAFFESFVNSIGYDYSQRNQSKITSNEFEILNGTKKGHFLSLEDKIEKYPAIIRIDKKPVIITSDPKQIKEPFITLFGQIKEIRNSSVHYSPVKESIWLPPTAWLKKAENTSKNCINAATLFWNACYPTSKGPTYLHNLDFEVYQKLARESLDWKNKLDELEKN